MQPLCLRGPLSHGHGLLTPFLSAGWVAWLSYSLWGLASFSYMPPLGKGWALLGVGGRPRVLLWASPVSPPDHVLRDPRGSQAPSRCPQHQGTPVP